MYIAADPLLTTGALFGRYNPAAESLLEQQIPYGAPFYARGRVALWAALRTMGIGHGCSLLIPSYICDSVLGPVEAVGASVKFYPVSCDLTINPGTLEQSIESSTRAVLVPHYFGVPTPIAEIKSICERRDIWLIEDCAHALYSFDGPSPLGRSGHAAMFSPWKSLPIPDGGILVLNDSRLVRPEPLPEPRVLGLAAGMLYRTIPTLETAVGWTPRLEVLGRSDVRESMQDRDRRPDFPREAGSDFSYQVLERSDGVVIRERRRRNYERLAKAVASQPYLRALIPALGDGICPLGFPILVSDRERARRHFQRWGINVRAYWERLPREVSESDFPDAHKISREILILPVHQSLTPRQIAHVERAIGALSQGVSE